MSFHSGENEEPNKTNKRAKQHAESAEVIDKVMDYAAKGKLGSLTIPELKMFLTTKKAKVGGKKEELIQRVTGLLT
ncbi:hypothetical protein AMTR_s02233p00009320 [Amborella trichopoda]|uniref:SAP domain-containing protein n=1 Tax=Amborella trichopoda TaxID=13333 RepID=U5CVL3_AMBTC|nr:hypothetical protein AMTR_s02233p00009320 [Amborella trichopoda]